jgi:hypothetical protein
MTITYFLIKITHKIKIQSLDKNGKSKFTDPLPFPKVPLILLAYLLLRYNSISLYMLFKLVSSTRIRTPAFAPYLVA